jgi:hypothetical protein
MRRKSLLSAILLLVALFTSALRADEAAVEAQRPLHASHRTVTVNWVDTYWSPSGPVKVPAPSSAALNIEALIPQSDGAILLLEASATSKPGVFTIANVPSGNYWLAAGGGGAFWTNTSTFDAGRDLVPPQTPVNVSASDTGFDFSLTGIASQNTEEYLEFFTDPPFGNLLFGFAPGTSSLSQTIDLAGNVNWLQINTGFLMQYELEPLGSLNNYVLGPELTLSNLALVTGATNDITGMLNAATETSVDLKVSGSKWASVFKKIGPAVATVQASILTLTVEPYVREVNATQSLPFPSLSLVAPTPGGLGILFQSGKPPLFDPQASICADYTGDTVSIVPIEPPILTNQNFGALQYGDPFDSTWTRALALCQQATVPIPIPNSSETYSFVVEDGASVIPSNAPLGPTALPVRNPTINGSSLYTPKTSDRVSPTLNWTAPGGPAPYGYKVRVYVLTSTPAGAPVYESVGTYSTAGTSLTVPPVAAGNTYIFTITTEVDGAANMQMAPYRSALPIGFASIVSAPITISPGAATPQIDGDLEEWNRLLNPKSGSEAPTYVQPPTHSPCVVSGRSVVFAFCE